MCANSQPTTDIVIVFYGDRSELETCLESIETHCTAYEIHVVDNNWENVGFTREVNKGIQIRIIATWHDTLAGRCGMNLLHGCYAG